MNCGKIKFILIIIGFAIIDFSIKAENANRYNNIFVDFFGNSNLVSVNYDSRFGRNAVFGWRAGVGFSRSGFYYQNRYSFLPVYRSGISLPIGVNALFGKHTSKFEIGAVITPSLAAYRESVSEHNENGGHITYDIGPTIWRKTCAFSLDLGYRLQRENGFLFRAGISPCLDVNKTCISIHMLSFLPYLSFGYTFN